MKYVLDSNVAAKWLLRESDSAKASRLRDDYRQNLHDLIAPDVLPVEVGHALTRAERQGRISQSDSLHLWLDMMTTAPRFFAYVPLMPRALALSSQARIGVYDCLYVALAVKEQCLVVSADQRLLNTFPSHTVHAKTLRGRRAATTSAESIYVWAAIIDDRGHAMNVIEETIDATLDSNGQLQLAQQPRLPPGPVQVTFRPVSAGRQQRGLADVVREIAAEQRARGFAGELRAEEEARLAEDAERDQELDAARGAACRTPSRRL